MQPAFPQYVINNGGAYVDGGMTLRDYFAAKAMQGLLASEVNAPLDVFTKQAYKVADKMMEARDGSQ